MKYGLQHEQETSRQIQEIMTDRPTVLNKPAINGPNDRPKDDQIEP